MSRLSKILVTISFLFSMNFLDAQSTLLPFSGFPLKKGDSPLFGKDIIINDNPTQNQRKVALCSAFNGWLYAAYSYFTEPDNFPALTILKSIDNGITWSVLMDGFLPIPDDEFKRIDLLSTGDSTSNIKVILSMVYSGINSSTDIGQAYLIRYNGETGMFEYQLFSEPFCYDIAIAGDLLYPSSNSNPSSIGFLYSKYSNQGDSIIFQSSSNGGMTLNNRKVLAVTGKRFKKVALTYGRSLSWNSGRYFAAWEEKNSWTSTTGHIYTAHSEPNFNSPFTNPVCLDSLDPSAINKARKPVIACQVNDVDNDSANLTEVVLFEKYIPADNKYNIEGFFNKKATNTNHFTQFSLNSSSDNRQQPSMNFNPFDSTFMVTCYDSSTQKLPFLRKNFNLLNPDVWQVVTSGYNDDANLGNPYPKVALSIGQQQGANIWSNEGTGGNGVAMFDAQYSTWTGISDNIKTRGTNLINAYPNPCSNEIKIAFEIKKKGKVTIQVLSILGQPLGTVTNQCYSEGKNVILYDVSNFPTGTYLFKFNSDDGISNIEKFSIIR